MPVFPNIKAAFIHIPKTGGTSISEALYKADSTIATSSGLNSVFVHKHERAIDIQGYCEDSVYNTLFKFATVRNPWDRIASWFFYYKNLWSSNLKDEITCKNFCSKSFLSCDFKEWVLSLEENYEKIIEQRKIDNCGGEADCPLVFPMSQFDYIKDFGNFVIIDEIIKFEEIDEGWKVVCEKLNIKSDLPYVNRGKIKSYGNLYTDKMDKVIRKLYSKEIDLLGYTKPND